MPIDKGSQKKRSKIHKGDENRKPAIGVRALINRPFGRLGFRFQKQRLRRIRRQFQQELLQQRQPQQLLQRELSLLFLP